MPPAVQFTLLIATALAAAWLVQGALYMLIGRFISRRDVFWRPLVARTRGPVRMAIAIAAMSVAVNAAALTSNELATARQVLAIGFILCLAWVARAALDIWVTLHLRRFRLDVEDNLLARKHVTQSRILQRVADSIILAVGVAAALMTFEGVRQYGISILASAGAAGLVIGLALQPVLKNIFAGIQLAMTQPIRIDDAVIVEGEWGNVEEITATYVVVKIWDRRRLIVPLNYFIENPFQNWTREEAALTGSIMIYLDYSVPVDALRAEARRIIESTPLWDRQVFAVQVTDFRETVMEVRVLGSASNAGKAFDLRCLLREKLAEYLRETHPEGLPRRRGTVTLESAGATDARAPTSHKGAGPFRVDDTASAGTNGNGAG